MLGASGSPGNLRPKLPTKLYPTSHPGRDLMSFVFAVCQAGAEAALKNEISRRHPELRFAYSRPGFVTFKTPDTRGFADQFQLKSVFARTWGHSIGKVVGSDTAEMAKEFGDLLAANLTAEQLTACRHLHVWERDRFLPGSREFRFLLKKSGGCWNRHAMGMQCREMSMKSPARANWSSTACWLNRVSGGSAGTLRNQARRAGRAAYLPSNSLKQRFQERG